MCSNLQRCQISSESDLKSKLASKCPNKGGTPRKEVRLQKYICLSSFFCLLFSFFSLYNTVRDKYFWNFVSRSQICLRVPNLPEFIIKSYCLLLAVPRDSPNCKKHSVENNLHEREYDIRKDLNLGIVLTKNIMQSFLRKEVRKCNGLAMLQRLRKRVKGKDWPIRYRNWSRWKEKQKDTFDLNSFYNFYEMEISKKTNRLAAQKDQENI